MAWIQATERQDNKMIKKYTLVLLISTVFITMNCSFSSQNPQLSISDEPASRTNTFELFHPQMSIESIVVRELAQSNPPLRVQRLFSEDCFAIWETTGSFCEGCSGGIALQYYVCPNGIVEEITYFGGNGPG